MIAGHFGFAAMVKSRERTTPLWALMLATVWLDIIFIPLLMTHHEAVQTVHPGYGGSIIHADYTHSIVGALALSAALGAMFLPKLRQAGRGSNRAGERVALGPRPLRASRRYAFASREPRQFSLRGPGTLERT